MTDVYAQAGVNVSAGDAFSAHVGKLCQSTYGNCDFIEFGDFSKGNFRGAKPFKIVEGRGFYQDSAPDGVGTKVGLYDILVTHPNAARDLVAMTAGDATAKGEFPGAMVDILSVRSLGTPGSPKFELFVSMFEELVAIANSMGMVIHKGETAEKGVFVGTDNPDPYAPFDWEGFVTCVAHPDKMIHGDRVKAGDEVIALREYGLRSNGLSLMRNGFIKQYGEHYHANRDSWVHVRQATVPSMLYDRMLNTAHGWYAKDLQPLFDLRLIAHLTGGGIGKFVELLRPSGLSAVLDDLYDPPDIMRKCAEWMEVPDDQCYTTWSCGQGKLVVVPPKQSRKFIKFAGKHGIEAKVCGRITDTNVTAVELTSKFHGEKFIFT